VAQRQLRALARAQCWHGRAFTHSAYALRA
jgi:hypothetical protein